MVSRWEEGNHALQLRTGELLVAATLEVVWQGKYRTSTAEESQAGVDGQSRRQSCRQFVGHEPMFPY